MYDDDIRRNDRRVEVTETVGDVYDTIRVEPATIPESAVLRDAVDAILSRNVTRKAYVVDAEGRLKGVITMEALMRHLSYRMGARPAGIRSFFRFVAEMESDSVANFMVKVAPVTKATNLADVIGKVVEDRLNDFPIVDENGRLLGELNTLGILRTMRGLFAKS